MVDVSLLETMFQLMGPLVALYALTGELQPRLGSGLPYTVPRGTYRCADGQWVAVSTSSDTVARRVLVVLGVGDDERFSTFAGRAAHRDELEAVMAAWCAARTSAAVLAELTTAEAAVGPVMDMADIAADPHFAAREAITAVDGTPMQGLIARLSATPGRVRWAGRHLDADGDEVRRDRLGATLLPAAGRIRRSRDKWGPARSVRGGHADRAGHAGAAEPAVAVRVLRQVLLVVGLGVVEGAERRRSRW